MNGAYSRTVLPTFIVAALLLASSCLFAVGALLFGMVCCGARLWQAAVVFPAFWVTVEFVVGATVGPRHIRQYQLFADGFSADLANCFGNRNLGNQLLLLSVRRHPRGRSAIWSSVR